MGFSVNRNKEVLSDSGEVIACIALDEAYYIRMNDGRVFGRNPGKKFPKGAYKFFNDIRAYIREGGFESDLKRSELND
jgi:hypothetical protein